MREYYVRQLLGEGWGVIQKEVGDTSNGWLICRCVFEPNAHLICDALNARESLARALGVKLDDASI